MLDIQASTQLHASRPLALVEKNERMPIHLRQERQLIVFSPTLLDTLVNLPHLFTFVLVCSWRSSLFNN